MLSDGGVGNGMKVNFATRDVMSKVLQKPDATRRFIHFCELIWNCSTTLFAKH